MPTAFLGFGHELFTHPAGHTIRGFSRVLQGNVIVRTKCYGCSVLQGNVTVRTKCHGCSVLQGNVTVT